MRTLRDLDLKNRKVLLRVDFNVPLDKEGNITDETRIKAALPSIRYILEKGGIPILMSHLGRPKGTDPKSSLKPCAKRLSELLEKSVLMATDCIGEKVEAQVSQLKPEQVLLLENLRFHRGEEKPETDPSFVKELAKLGDLYVNDAFGTAHRAHASTAKVASYFPQKTAVGFLMEKEVRFLEQLLRNPERPFYAIIGGAKISTKIGVLRALLSKVDALFIGGGMSFTFFKTLGISIGDSLCESECVGEAQAILETAKQLGKKVYLPVDHLIVTEISKEAAGRMVDTDQGIPEGYRAVDIGPKTILEYTKLLSKGKTVFWNGPMGVFEYPQFAKGTQAIANLLADIQGTTVVGGGESVAAVEAAGVADRITHISTGGGATLEYIEFGQLPGILALED